MVSIVNRRTNLVGTFSLCGVVLELLGFFLLLYFHNLVKKKSSLMGTFSCLYVSGL